MRINDDKINNTKQNQRAEKHPGVNGWNGDEC